MASAPTLSLSMIVRDEEETIGRVLGDVAGLCDEIVVVDTGSTDATVEVARSLGASVSTFEWCEDFAAARNEALNRCHGDWVLWLDADDRIPATAKNGLERLVGELKGRSSVDAVALPYRVVYAPANPAACLFSVNRERLLRRAAGLSWRGRIHEFVPVDSQRLEFSDLAWVEHRPLSERRERKATRNRTLIEAAISQGEDTALMRVYLARELHGEGRDGEAAAEYEKALESDLAPDHRYDALCGLAECAAALGHDDVAIDHYLQAIAIDSRRANAFLRLGLFHYERGEWRRAMPFFAALTVLERPAGSFGFFVEAAYSWLAWDYLAICAAELGQLDVAIEMTYRALPEHPERERLLANLRFYLDEIDRDEHRSDRPEWVRRSRLGW